MEEAIQIGGRMSHNQATKYKPGTASQLCCGN
jgi:hypothetical protein